MMNYIFLHTTVPITYAVHICLIRMEKVSSTNIIKGAFTQNFIRKFMICIKIIILSRAPNIDTEVI